MHSMQEFDRWNKEKKRIEGSAGARASVRARDVWYCSIGKNIGVEVQGTGYRFERPVLILAKFNRHMFWGIPLTTQQHQFNFFYNFSDPDGRNVAANIAQLRLFSSKRVIRKLYKLDRGNFKQIQRRLKQLIDGSLDSK